MDISSGEGLIVVCDIVGFSPRTGNEQRRIMEHLWRFLNEDPALPAMKPARDGTLDGAVLAFAQTDHQAVLDLATRWIEWMKNADPAADLRIGIHHGRFERMKHPGDTSEMVFGTGPNDCYRITSVGDAGHILVSEEFVLSWKRDHGDNIFEQLVPKLADAPIQLFLKPGAPQCIRVYNRSRSDQAATPTRLATLNVIALQLNDHILPDIARFFLKLLMEFAQRAIPARGIAPRVSIFAPDPRRNNNLTCTDYRYLARPAPGEDPKVTQKGKTVYSLNPIPTGPVARAFTSGKPQVIAGLPRYRRNSDAYVAALAEFDVPPHLIEGFTRHARAFVAVPFKLLKDECDGVICIDTLDALDPISLSDLSRIADTIESEYSLLVASLWRLRV